MGKPLRSADSGQHKFSPKCGFISIVILFFGSVAVLAAATSREIFLTVAPAVMAAMGLMIFLLWKIKKLENLCSEMTETSRLSDRRLAAIEAAGDGIGLVNSKGELIYMNRALMELHGIMPDDLDKFIGSKWETLYSEKGQRQVHEKVMPFLLKNRYWKGESPILRQDGQIVYAEMTLTLLPDGGLIGTARDITDRKQAEKEKAELQQQIFQTRKLESVGRLAGGIAHDFNNILASMLGYTEFLLEDLDTSSTQHQFARQIMRGGTQARHLIDQILSFSRRREITRYPFDAVETVRDVATMLKVTLPVTLNFEIHVPVEHAYINGNATQISQALINLCLNASDAMEDQHGTLRVEVFRLKGGEMDFPSVMAKGLPPENYAPEIRIVEKEKRHQALYLGVIVTGKPYVAISVSDTGSGMSRDVMENLFDPFFTTKEMDKGTGLGLPTIMGTLSAHQGAAMVESREGEGSRFIMYFPLEENAIIAEKADKIKNMAVAGEGRILVVEDQENVRAMLQEMLQRFGYNVIVCPGAREALDLLRQNPDACDLVFSDYLMPEMTGLELAEELYTTLPNMPVLLISGYGYNKLDQAREGLPSIKAVFRKPLDSQAISHSIKAILGNAKAA